MSYYSLEEILSTAKDSGKNFYEVILEDDCSEREVSREDSLLKMKELWETMKAADASYDKTLTSASGMTGKAGGQMSDYVAAGHSIAGNFVGTVIAKALSMGESNACMRRIVAAPTAGACGVLPAVLIPCYEESRAPESTMIESLYVAAGIGQIIASRASIAGASGGCQAEIGSASAMAAGALVYLHGGTNEQITSAAAMALKNLLGLVCDPVAGLVEVPCVKRNVVGAVNAIAAADMALAGIKSRIPADEVIDAMREVGDKMDSSLKETGLGGLAATPEAQKYTK